MCFGKGRVEKLSREPEQKLYVIKITLKSFSPNTEVSVSVSAYKHWDVCSSLTCFEHWEWTNIILSCVIICFLIIIITFMIIYPNIPEMYELNFLFIYIMLLI